MAIYVRCQHCKSDTSVNSAYFLKGVCKKCGEPFPKYEKLYIIRVTHNGKTVTKTIGNSLKAARELEAKIKSELVSGDYYDRRQAARENIKYKDYITNKYMPYAKSNKKSYDREEVNLRLWILPVIGDKPIKNISPFDIEKIKKKMAEANKAPRTIQYVIAIIRHTINKAVDWGIYTGINPATRVKKPKINNKRTRFLTPNEAQDLLSELQKHSIQTYEMALLSLHTGMRAGEIFNLKFGDIDFANGIIHIRDPKSGEDRVAYLTEEISDMLSSKQGEPNEYVFKDENGNRIERISKTFFRVVDKLGLNKGITDDKDKVVFHTLRHTFASWLAMKGTPIYTIKELMGHKTLAMTERYSHLSPNTQRDAISNISDMLRGNSNVVTAKFDKG